jgi:hypothetical protein
MADDILLNDLEKEGKKKKPRKATKRSKAKKPAKPEEKKEVEVKRTSHKNEESHLFNLIIAVVVILGIIGIVFGYTKDKISEIKHGGTEATKGLEKQVENLKEQLVTLQEKTTEIEADSIQNKNVVLDLFDKNRTIPTKVDATNWNALFDPELSFVVSYPKTWEKVKPVIETPGEGEPQVEIVYFQPIGKSDYLNGISIKTDYVDFASLTLNEKEQIFSELDLVDVREMNFGKMLYFINLDKNNNEVPTILILTEDNIYRATFNVYNKKLRNYFEYRKDFENIVATFGLAPDLEELEDAMNDLAEDEIQE